MVKEEGGIHMVPVRQRPSTRTSISGEWGEDLGVVSVILQSNYLFEEKNFELWWSRLDDSYSEVVSTRP